MEKIITSGEFWSLVAMVILLGLLLEAIHCTRRNLRNLRAVAEQVKGLNQELDAIEAEQDERDRRRMVHEADKEGSWGMCGYTPVFIPKKEEGPMVSMEPFCGEGKKP